MKRSIVPAQVTTVEDRLVGGLTPHQLALLIGPFCFGFIAFAVMPPNFHLVLYKLVMVLILESIGAVLSIRIKGKILLLWIVTVARYNGRPRYYKYNKNDLFLRDTVSADAEVNEAGPGAVVETRPEKERPPLDLADVVKVEALMENPDAKLRFITGKDGRLNVVIQEVKQ